MRCYTHLTIEDRENILRYLSQGKSIRETGTLIGRSPSTISRELKRNGKEELYSPHQAHKCYKERKHNSGPTPILIRNRSLRNQVRWMITHLWCSPEQVANRLAWEGAACVSTSTIYRAFAHSLSKSVRQYLRRSKTLGKRKGPGKGGDNKKFVRSIHQRPEPANMRSEPGHLEGDTVHLRKQEAVIITVVDRCTRMLYTALSPGKDASSVQKAMKQLLETLPHQERKTLTLDRGSEFALLPDLEAELGFTCYFCDPMSPRQRATNENFNGLLRQYFPKHSTTFPTSQLSSFTALLNLRPRKCLAWLAPFERHSGAVLHFT